MAHFAEIDENGIVLRVIVVGNDDIKDNNGAEQEQLGIDFCKNLLGGDWVQTSYNSNIRKNYAGIGFTYDAARNAFIPPKLFNSWILDENTCKWNPPVPHPGDDKLYDWDEATQSWVLRNV